MEKITLDSDALRDLIEERQRGIATMHDIWKLVEQGEVEWAITRGVDYDIPDGQLRQRLERLPVLSLVKTGKVARLDEWVLGVDVLGGDEFLRLEEDIRAEWKPGQKPLPGREDFDHIHTHWALGRDVFLTWDKGVLALADKFARLGIRVQTPDQYLEQRRGSGLTD